MSEESEMISDLAKNLLSAVRRKCTKELQRLASDSRKQLQLHSLKKDKHKMYEKIGREVERLIEAGDVDHPGLCRGIERIHQLDDKITQLSQKNSVKKD